MKSAFINLRTLCFLAVVFVLPQGIFAADSFSVPKLCWAHYVAWGFDHVSKYDQWASSPERGDPLTDRSLLGKNIQWDSGVSEGTRRQIDVARLWGFDGFTVDVVLVTAFSDIMRKFYRAAEGTNFKISLCIDNHRQVSVETMTDHLGRFIREFKDHPNSVLIDGRLMIFSYHLGMSDDDWLAVRTKLKEKGLDAYYVNRVMSEAVPGMEPQQLANALRGWDGIYDFGCNGFTQERMIKRLQLAKDALVANRPKGILVAGIAPGYLGQSTGFYRPYLNSKSLRDNWEAALAVHADQVCITTWNDYVEHTHFEPSAVNRTALLRINQEYKARWKNEPVPLRPAQVIFSYLEEVLMGNDLTLEVLNLSYSTPEETAFVRFLDEKGTVIREFKPIPLAQDKMTTTTLRMTDEEIKDYSLIRVQAAVKRPGDSSVDYRELFPITRRYGKLESCRTVRLPFDEISFIPINLKIEDHSAGENTSHINKAMARVAMKTWTAAGRVELLRNGFPIAEKEINHIKAPVCVLEFPIPERNRALHDVYVVRYTNTSDGIGLSNAVSRIVSSAKEAREQPILISGSDFDENWPIWYERISRLPRPEVQYRKIPLCDSFFIHFKFSQGQGETIFPESGWNIPLNLVGGKPNEIWKRTQGPDSVERMVLSFTGKESGKLPSRIFPADAFTLEMILRPGKNVPPGEQTLFRDDSGCLLKLDTQLRPVFINRNVTLAPDVTLTPDRWVRLTAVNDMRDLILYLDGKEIARKNTPLTRRPINSVAAIGEGFFGDIADFLLKSGVH